MNAEIYVVEVHYPMLVDGREEAYDTRAEAMAAMQRHCEAGANVQMYRVFWRQMKVEDGWYKATKS